MPTTPRKINMTLEKLPVFPEMRQIGLGDREWVDSLFSRFPTEISERTFGSIYIWRNYGGRSLISQLDGHMIVSWYKPRLGRALLVPVGPDPAGIIHSLCGPGDLGPDEFRHAYGLVEPLVSDLSGQGLEPSSVRDEWDYVYSREDMVRLEGPKYHTQRKEMRKATSSLDLVYEPMTGEHRKACLDLEETWCDVKHCTLDSGSAAEDIALREALDSMNALGLIGAVVLVDGKIQALTVGEKLNESTAVVHFEKANPGIRGLYQVINQRFCERALDGFEFVNREQDVGEPGLRRAKEGYHPHHFVEKHILRLGTTSRLSGR